jgi:hypothetical protein
MGIREQIGDEPSFLSPLSLIVASVVMFVSREIPPSSNDTPSSPCYGEGFFSSACVKDRVADPQHLNADPDPAFFSSMRFRIQPFHFHPAPDLDPAPHQKDEILRPPVLVYRPFMAPF